MANSLEEAREAVMKLADPDRQLLAEEIIAARWNPEWRPAWASELERRRQRLVNGDDRELTVEEFFQRSLALRVAFSSAARRDRQNAEAWYASRSRVALESFISELGAAVRFISDYLRELHSLRRIARENVAALSLLRHL